MRLVKVPMLEGEAEKVFCIKKSPAAADLAKQSGTWSENWARKMGTWLEHLERHPESWAARLLLTRDSAWLRVQRI